MELAFRQPAKPGTVFAPDAFTRQVGEMVPFKMGDKVIAEARIVSVVVSDDGTEAEIVVEAPTPDVQRIGASMMFEFAFPEGPVTCEIVNQIRDGNLPPMSFGFRETEQPVDPLLRDFVERRGD